MQGVRMYVCMYVCMYVGYVQVVCKGCPCVKS